MLMCDAVNTHTVCQVGCKWRSTAVSHVHAKLPNCCQPRPVSFLPDKQCNLRGRHTDEWKAQVNEKNCFLRKLAFSLLSALVRLQHILLYISICTWLHLKVRFFTCFSTAQSCGQFSGFFEWRIKIWIWPKKSTSVLSILVQRLSGDHLRITANFIFPLLLSL